MKYWISTGFDIHIINLQAPWITKNTRSTPPSAIYSKIYIQNCVHIALWVEMSVVKVDRSRVLNQSWLSHQYEWPINPIDHQKNEFVGIQGVKMSFFKSPPCNLDTFLTLDEFFIEFKSKRARISHCSFLMMYKPMDLTQKKRNRGT